ncbi:hypothetical protein T310_9835 [Rasamsonia emersonii CBS 393.64]|uniref:Uncharacterized protein n=1 Tax=Rasamsonia emersonii (strain ATCC 16479 / CBS 393.64 / IMI 116815) TaxID=1408163 RepID=A0A0F4YG18_RASE3|nr:hypothetical protein T310_9835 [Rasamsonia emersonii CBS 393.64]KKA16568.1 hypothetical protein T310_9835 [Rasamsonia emersonii CBS 393.64]
MVVLLLPTDVFLRFLPKKMQFIGSSGKSMGTLVGTGSKFNTGYNLGPERQFPCGNDSRRELTSVGSASPRAKVDNKARLCQSPPTSSWD